MTGNEAVGKIAELERRVAMLEEAIVALATGRPIGMSDLGIHVAQTHEQKMEAAKSKGTE